MSTAPLTLPAPRVATVSRRSFARRRLHLGITAVGITVVLSLVWLVVLLVGLVPIPADWRLVPGLAGIPLTAGAGAATLFVVHALLLRPLESIGGRDAVRYPPSAAVWNRSWWRGVAVLAVAATVGSAMLATAGAVAGTIGAALVTAALSTALLGLQGPLARLVARLETRPPNAGERELLDATGLGRERARVVSTSDEAFVGGWLGVGPWRELWIPDAWTRPEHAALLRVQLVRRAAQRAVRARSRGWWRAAAWPAAGTALLTPLLPWGWSDPLLWLALPAVATLWSFVGVLVLPAASRPATYRADVEAARVLGVEPVAQVIRQLDAMQDDEPHRSALVEFVFHPVPAAGRREQFLRTGRPGPNGGGLQQARLALLASLAAGSLLGRMVHCNLGRPALWVVYPGD